MKTRERRITEAIREMTTPRQSGALRQIPSGIWALGFVSMLADISSEIIHSLLPVFMMTVLGASALTVGLIEGAAEATAPQAHLRGSVEGRWRRARVAAGAARPQERERHHALLASEDQRALGRGGESALRRRVDQRDSDDWQRSIRRWSAIFPRNDENTAQVQPRYSKAD